MYDTTTGEIMMKFDGHTKSIEIIKLNFKSTRLFTCSADSNVKVWNI